jgi:hypothetical protein
MPKSFLHPVPWRFALVSLLVSVAALFFGTACSGGAKDEGDSEPADADADGTGTEGSDEPAWVNAMYLTCDWASAETRTDAGVSCDLAGDAPEKDKLAVESWRIKEKGEDYATSMKRDGDKVTFVLPAKRVVDMAVGATVSDGARSANLEVDLKDVLEGLAKDGVLAQCFNTSLQVSDCFAALGIDAPTGDAVTGGMIDKANNACAHKDKLPKGVLCSLESDGLAGDWDMARDWYMLGNDILAEDGTVKAADFCDASGIKAQSPRGTTERVQRWYPFPLDQGDKLCTKAFEPRKLDDPALSGRHVLFDPAQGKDGEPYCYFVLINEQTYFGGFIRMHILKNPRLFPDAANGPELTEAALKATVDHFGCLEAP